MKKAITLAALLLMGCHSDHTDLVPVPIDQQRNPQGSSGGIPLSNTIIPGGTTFGIVNDTDQVGGWAVETSETTIGAIAAGRLKIGERRYSTATGVVYQLTSLTPAGGFANGTWSSCADASAPIPFFDGGAFTCLAGGGSGSAGTLGASGADVVGLFDGGTIVIQISGDGGLNAFGTTGFLPIRVPDVITAAGSNGPVQNYVNPVTIADAGVWTTIAGATPTANSYEAWEAEFLFGDFSGHGPSLVNCVTKFFVAQTDAGLFVAPSAGAGAWGGALQLIPLACTDIACSNAGCDGGTSSSGPGPLTFQAVVDGGGVVEQVMLDASTPWRATPIVQRIHRISGTP